MEETLKQLNTLLQEEQVNKTDEALDSIAKTLQYLEPKQGIQGVKGDKGDKGEQGIQGEQGVPGVNGKNGKDGIDGKDAVLPEIKQWTEEDIDAISKRHAARISALASLSDVDVTKNLTNGVFLRFNATTGRWEPNANAAAAAWGAITGTLSSQIDLQNVLNAKQDTLVSGTNIKTVNGVSVLGAGDIPLPNGTSIVSTSTNATIPVSDGLTVYLVDATGGNVNIILPSAVANTGQYCVTKVDISTNTVTLIGTVNGNVNSTLDYQDDSAVMISNGTSYRLI